MTHMVPAPWTGPTMVTSLWHWSPPCGTEVLMLPQQVWQVKEWDGLALSDPRGTAALGGSRQTKEGCYAIPSSS